LDTHEDYLTGGAPVKVRARKGNFAYVNWIRLWNSTLTPVGVEAAIAEIRMAHLALKEQWAGDSDFNGVVL